MTIFHLRVAAPLVLAAFASAACHDPTVDATARVAFVDANAAAPLDADAGSAADAGSGSDSDAGSAVADAGVADAPYLVDAWVPPDGPPPPPPPCVPETATTYDDITVVRQDAPADGKWVRVAMVSWDPKDATRNTTAPQAAADKVANLVEIEKFAVVAKKQCAELVIFPELSIVGYPSKASDPNALKTSNFRSRAEAASYIEAIPAVGTARANIAANQFPSARKAADIAATTGVPMHVTLLEQNGPAGKPYNTTLVFDKDGTLVARHRKHNVRDPLPLNFGAENPAFYDETAYLTGGDDATVYAHPKLGRVGVMTCADMYPQVDEDGKTIEPAPHWREKYLGGGGFSFMSVSSAWNDPFSTPFDPEWTAMAQVEKLSSWANPNARTNRWIGFSNTVSNGQKAGEGFTALVATPYKVVVSTAKKGIVIGYAPAP